MRSQNMVLAISARCQFRTQDLSLVKMKWRWNASSSKIGQIDNSSLDY